MQPSDYRGLEDRSKAMIEELDEHLSARNGVRFESVTRKLLERSSALISELDIKISKIKDEQRRAIYSDYRAKIIERRERVAALR